MKVPAPSDGFFLRHVLQYTTLFLLLLATQSATARETFDPAPLLPSAETADLSVLFDTTESEIDPGGEAILRIRVRNRAGITATDVVVTTTLPSEWSLRTFTVDPQQAATCAQQGEAVRCPIGSVELDEQIIIGLVVRVSESTPPGLITVSTMGSSSTPDSNLSNNTSTYPFRVFRALRVTTTDDFGAGSLRDVIIEANRLCDEAGSPRCKISFSLSEEIPESGTHTIRPAIPLPPVTACSLIIEGPSRDPSDGPGPVVLPVTVDGSIAGPVDGLLIVPVCADGGLAHVRVSGLAINGFSRNGISIDGAGSFFITDNYIGTDASGTEARPNGLRGVFVASGAEFIDVEILRNVISGNGRSGIFLWQGRWTKIRSNVIGADVTGTKPLPNGASGVYVNRRNTRVSLAENTISFNGHFGLGVDYDTTGVETFDDVFEGNVHEAVDYGLDRLTPNDADESDGVWNYPELTDAFYDGATGHTIVRGILRSAAPPSEPEPNSFNVLLHKSSSPARDAKIELVWVPGVGALFGPAIIGPRHGMSGVRVPFEQAFELRVPGDLRGSFVRPSIRHVQSNYITPIVSGSEFGQAIAVR